MSLSGVSGITVEERHSVGSLSGVGGITVEERHREERGVEETAAAKVHLGQLA